MTANIEPRQTFRDKSRMMLMTCRKNDFFFNWSTVSIVNLKNWYYVQGESISMGFLRKRFISLDLNHFQLELS